jgi:SAM-dependent methyltransferase
MPAASGEIDDRLFRGIAVYQDVVLDGRTVRQGTRDCPGRWSLIAPHLAGCATLLDVGSNFGWFGLRACREWPRCVVASVEADERSAAVQRQVLASHDHRRVCLLTHRGGTRLARRFEDAGTRFDAALCLNVLHWIADHRAFVPALGRIARRIVVEHPHPDEAGSGVEAIRREIGPIGPYLAGHFPDRPVARLAVVESHRQSNVPREVWLVGPAADDSPMPQPGIAAAALLDLSPGWPPRSWWRRQLETLSAVTTPDVLSMEPRRDAPRDATVLFAAGGLQPTASELPPELLERMRRQTRRVPEHRLLSCRDWMARRARGLIGATARRLGLR